MFAWFKRRSPKVEVAASQALELKRIAQNLSIDLLKKGLKPKYANWVVYSRYPTLVALNQRLTFTLDVMAAYTPPARGAKLLEEEKIYIFDFYSQSSGSPLQLAEHLLKFQDLSITFLNAYFELENKAVHTFEDTQKLKIALPTYMSVRSILYSFMSFQME